MVLEFAGLLLGSLNNLDSIFGLFLFVSIDFEYYVSFDWRMKSVVLFLQCL